MAINRNFGHSNQPREGFDCSDCPGGMQSHHWVDRQGLEHCQCRPIPRFYRRLHSTGGRTIPKPNRKMARGGTGNFGGNGSSGSAGGATSIANIGTVNAGNGGGGGSPSSSTAGNAGNAPGATTTIASRNLYGAANFGTGGAGGTGTVAPNPNPVPGDTGAAGLALIYQNTGA